MLKRSKKRLLHSYYLHQRIFQSVKFIRTFGYTGYTETNEIGINKFNNLKHVHDVSEPRSRGNQRLESGEMTIDNDNYRNDKQAQ